MKLKVSMSEEDNEVIRLANIQSNLFTIEQLLKLQRSKQDQLTNEMLECSSELIIELRLLSLVRSQIIVDKEIKVNRLVKSQILKGLSFSALQFCPTYFQPSDLSHYMSFIAFLRDNPNILARCLYHLSIKNPRRVTILAFSVVLTLFQQGWCTEEDKLLHETIIQLAAYQFQLPMIDPDLFCEANCLKQPLNSPTITLRNLEPLASFITAYLFNGASFSYLHCALGNVVTILYALSHLHDLRNQFQTDPDTGCIAAIDYWNIMAEQALMVLNSLIHCMELLPPGVSKIFRFIRSTEDGDDKCILLFFESFVNRALDNPAILGLIPWHPGYAEWSPTRDIASIFRSKYSNLIPSKFEKPLANVLSLSPFYVQIDFTKLLRALTSTDLHNNMISETELLSTNPNFPKELVITGKDIILLHEAALALPKDLIQNGTFQSLMERIGNHPHASLEKKHLAREHFKIVMERKKEIAIRARKIRTKSLFLKHDEIPNFLSNIPPEKDPFGEYFCDVIAALPSFHECIATMRPKNVKDLLEHVKILTPCWLEKKSIQQADAVLFYASHNCNLTDLIPRLEVLTELRNTRAVETADKTSSLRTQHQYIKAALKTVLSIRENVQSHLLRIITISLLQNDLNHQFKIAMSRSHEFLTEHYGFNHSYINISQEIAHKSYDLGLNSNQVSQIVKIMFFRMTDHITLNRFITSDKETNRRSDILYQIISTHQNTILPGITKTWKGDYELRKKYLERAGDQLCHIRPSSGISILFHHIVEAVALCTELAKNSKTLKFDPCMIYVMVRSSLKHIYGVGAFVSHFLLGNSTLDALLTAKEIQHLGVFCSTVEMLLTLCSEYDSSILEWGKFCCKRK